MTPEDYYTEIVMPTLSEFRNDPTSRRKTYLACMVLYHIKDHLKEAGKKNVLEKLKQLAGDDFEIVRSIANASKHAEIRGEDHKFKIKAGEDIRRPPGVLGEFELGFSELDDTVGSTVIFVDNKYFDLLDSIDKLDEAVTREYFCD